MRRIRTCPGLGYDLWQGRKQGAKIIFIMWCFEHGLCLFSWGSLRVRVWAPAAVSIVGQSGLLQCNLLTGTQHAGLYALTAGKAG
jgi:hypothetical protein